jgi:putative aldouronate transport system substrate-binding protein
MKRAILLVLAIVFVSAFAFAGSQSESGSTGLVGTVNPGGTFPIVDEPITMSAFAPLNMNVDTLSIERNVLTQYIAELTNVRLDFVEVPSGQANEKLNILLASGDYTDLIFRPLTKSSELLYGQQGVLVVLNDYIEEYGVETKKMWSTREHIRLNQIQSDGNIYGMARSNECFHCFYSQKMWVNTEWMTTLGLDIPTTLDEYADMLRAFKTQDPNGNGKADEIPLSGSYVNGWNTKIDQYLMMPFIYNDGGNRHLIRDGQIIQAYSQPEWREGLKWMSMLYEEGLILHDTFTQDQTQLKALGENPGDAILGAFSAGYVGIAMQMEGPSGRDQIYKTIPPLNGPSGDRYARFTPDYGTNAYYITNTAENPAAGFRLGDYMYTAEFSVWNGWGMEGDTWGPPDAGAKGLDGVRPATRKMLLSWGNGNPLTWWNQLGSFLQSQEVRQGAQRSDSPSDLEVILFDETKYNYEPYTPPMAMIVPPLTFGEEVAAELSDLETTLNDYVNESVARFITGDLDIESNDWANYLGELDKIGVDRYVEIKQEAYESSPFFQD